MTRVLRLVGVALMMLVIQPAWAGSAGKACAALVAPTPQFDVLFEQALTRQANESQIEILNSLIDATGAVRLHRLRNDDHVLVREKITGFVGVRWSTQITRGRHVIKYKFKPWRTRTDLARDLWAYATVLNEVYTSYVHLPWIRKHWRGSIQGESMLSALTCRLPPAVTREWVDAAAASQAELYSIFELVEAAAPGAVVLPKLDPGRYPSLIAVGLSGAMAYPLVASGLPPLLLESALRGQRSNTSDRELCAQAGAGALAEAFSKRYGLRTHVAWGMDKYMKALAVAVVASLAVTVQDWPSVDSLTEGVRAASEYARQLQDPALQAEIKTGFQKHLVTAVIETYQELQEQLAALESSALDEAQKQSERARLSQEVDALIARNPWFRACLDAGLTSPRTSCGAS